MIKLANLTRAIAPPALALASLSLVVLACQEGPTDLARSEDGHSDTPSFDHQPRHGGGGDDGDGSGGCLAEELQLRITFRDSTDDDLQSDGLGPYSWQEGASAHLNAPTGNLKLVADLSADPARSVKVVTTAGTFYTNDRIYTNSSDNDSDGDFETCGLAGQPDGLMPGASGTAVLEVELGTDSVNDPEKGIIRYGKDCDGNPLPANRVATTRSGDGRTWTITGTSGLHCDQVGKKPVLTEVGTSGAFSMTLEEFEPDPNA